MYDRIICWLIHLNLHVWVALHCFHSKEFYMGGCDDSTTEVEIMWTNQHGTGKEADHFVESQVILQYMCQEFPDGEVPLTDINSQFDYHTIRNGKTSGTQAFNKNKENSDVKLTLGLHEPYNYYQSYLRRERNKGNHYSYTVAEPR